MRYILTVTTLLFCYSSITVAQSTKSYIYKYRFQISSKDPSYALVDSLKGIDTSKIYITVTDKKSNAIPFVTVSIRNHERKYSVTTDADGKLNLTVQPGTFELSLNCTDCKGLKQSISISDHSMLRITAVLVPHFSESYNIHSKKRLSNSELKEIKECINQNRSEPNKCSKRKSYFILIEI